MTENELKGILNEKLCDIGEVLLEYYDCCGMNELSCKLGDPNPCCSENTVYARGLCPHSIDNKCTFRNASCKLWICKTAIKTTDPKCVEALLLLEKFGQLFEIVRRPIIGQRYRGLD